MRRWCSRSTCSAFEQPVELLASRSAVHPGIAARYHCELDLPSPPQTVASLRAARLEVGNHQRRASTEAKVNPILRAAKAFGEQVGRDGGARRRAAATAAALAAAQTATQTATQTTTQTATQTTTQTATQTTTQTTTQTPAAAP